MYNKKEPTNMLIQKGQQWLKPYARNNMWKLYKTGDILGYKDNTQIYMEKYLKGSGTNMGTCSLTLKTIYDTL